MPESVFIDTNIFLYAGSAAPADINKSLIAKRLLLEQSVCISTQVVQEYISNVLRKPELGLDESNIDSFLAALDFIDVLPATKELITLAVALRRRYQLSHWDSCIVAAALELGSTTLYSEDFSHGQQFESVTIVNPFQSVT